MHADAVCLFVVMIRKSPRPGGDRARIYMIEGLPSPQGDVAAGSAVWCGGKSSRA